LVSNVKPGGDDGAVTPGDPGALEARLKAIVDENRETLFEPWVGMIAASPDFQGEMDRMVQLLQVFFNKWVVEIITVLGQRGTLRFGELKESLGGISGRTLSQRLRDLESQGLVNRRMFNEMPVRVEYSLTEKGVDVAMLALPLVLYLRVTSGT
jgi:DNA-binding HxlR family transcriptional regulator